jgi:hypothetical protein
VYSVNIYTQTLIFSSKNGTKVRLLMQETMKTSKVTMKTGPQTIRTAFWIVLGITIAFVSLALNRPLSSAQDTTPTPVAQAGAIVAEAGAVEDVGSTDGIMMLAVAIVLIIIIPILLKRQTWSNGKQK